MVALNTWTNKCNTPQGCITATIRAYESEPGTFLIGIDDVAGYSGTGTLAIYTTAVVPSATVPPTLFVPLPDVAWLFQGNTFALTISYTAGLPSRYFAVSIIDGDCKVSFYGYYDVELGNHKGSYDVGATWVAIN